MVAAASLPTFADDLVKNADIKAVVASMQNGWTRKNGDEFASRFGSYADYVVVNGDRLKGRLQIAAAHQHIFDTIYKASELNLKIENARLIRPDVSIVHVSTYLIIVDGNSSLQKRGRVTLVIAKRSGRWKITAFQNTPIAEDGGK